MLTIADVLLHKTERERRAKKMPEKNLCGKTRKIDNPYEVWRNNSGWEWRVLKKYKAPESEAKDPYARWFCFVTSPYCPDGEYGDTYVREIKGAAYKVQ